MNLRLLLLTFVPSFLTGSLIKRFGCLRIMAAGVALNLSWLALQRRGAQNRVPT